MGHESFDVAFAYIECDLAIMHIHDTFTRSRMMVERLLEPVHLGKRMATLFRNHLSTSIPAAIVEYGRNGYLEGIDALVKLELLDEGNIDEALDAAIAAGEVAVVSRLTEVKRSCFDMPLFDFDL